jgi:thiol-disulfide isomerase/thioredoxin
MRNLIIIVLFASLVSCTSHENICTITGKVDEEKKDTLLLFKASRFPRIEAEIPITDSIFSYSFKFIQPEAFKLTFKDEFQRGSMLLTTFFSEKGNVIFTLKPGGKTYDNKVVGSDLNASLNEYNNYLRSRYWNEVMKYSDSLSIMFKNGTALSKEAYDLINRLRNTTNDSIRRQLFNEQRYLENTGKDLTPKAIRFRNIQDSILQIKKRWEFDYIEKNTTFLAYYKFLESLQETAKSCCWQPVDIELTNKAQSNFDRFSKAFPDHPYNVIIQNTINGLLKIHEGGRFIDFNATNIDGHKVSLSETIKKNKLTLLDFWSIWCGPCLKTSKALIPIYYSYKDKGFQILGIAQEYGEMDSLISFIHKQKYPWETVIDKENMVGLWDKYNIQQQGGGVFLINSSGQIIGVNMTPDQIEQKLKENL